MKNLILLTTLAFLTVFSAYVLAQNCKKELVIRAQAKTINESCDVRNLSTKCMSIVLYYLNSNK